MGISMGKWPKSIKWPKNTFQGPIWVPKVDFLRVSGVYWVYKVVLEFLFGHPKCLFDTPKILFSSFWSSSSFLEYYVAGSGFISTISISLSLVTSVCRCEADLTFEYRPISETRGNKETRIFNIFGFFSSISTNRLWSIHIYLYFQAYCDSKHR